MNEERDRAAREYADKICPLKFPSVNMYPHTWKFRRTAYLNEQREKGVCVNRHNAGWDACAASKQEEIDRLVDAMKMIRETLFDYVVAVVMSRGYNKQEANRIAFNNDEVRLADSILSQYPVTDKEKSNG